MPTPSKLPIVYCRFLDHVSSSSEISAPFTCEVFGVLWKQDKNAYYVVSWIAENRLEDNNSECYCILKSTVLELRQLTLTNRRLLK